MTHFALPYRFAPTGTTTVADPDGQVRDMVSLVLFTRKGERINRPEFGAGMHELIFSENAPEIAAAAQHMVQAALQQWLAGVITVRAVEAEAIESLLRVQVSFSLIGDQQDRRITVEGRL